MRSSSDLRNIEKNWRKRRLFGPRRRGRHGLLLWLVVIASAGVGAMLLYQELSALT